MRVAPDRVILVLLDVTEERRLAEQVARIGTLLREVVAATHSYRRHAAAALGVGAASVAALEELFNRGLRTPASLARWLGLSANRVSGVLDELEQAGLVDRVRHPSDRRSRLVVLTPHARVAAAPLLDLLIGGIDRILDSRPPDGDVPGALGAAATALRTRARSVPHPPRGPTRPPSGPPGG